MSAFFVTAAGTDIGKTFVTAGIIRALCSRGEKVEAIKPLASGYDSSKAAESDPGVLLAAMGRSLTEQEIARVSPWRYKAALAPDMAAKRENAAVDFRAVVDFSAKAVTARAGILFIEGVGGVMAPIAERHTVLDWMEELRLPLIMVAGNYLGGISHALTALDVVARRGLDVVALVVNESAASTVDLQETATGLARFGAPQPVIIPRNADARAFGPLTDRLLAHPA